MSRPRWITSAGNLGSIPELFFYEKLLEVSTDDTSTHDPSVTFTFQSGELPPGIQVVKSGILQGVPVVLDPISVDETREYRFTIRARSSDGVVVDRTFFLSVNNVYPPVITPRINNLGNVFDGSYFQRQLRAVEENPSAVLKWKIIRGRLPPGLSMTGDGLISGYIIPEPDEYESIVPGYDTYNPNDPAAKKFFDDDPYDSLGKSRNRAYSFTVEVSDGANVDSLNYSISVASKGLFTRDQDHYISEDITNWGPNQAYPRGKILRYRDVLYVTTEDVFSTESNTPDVAPSYREYQIQKIAITVDNNFLTVDHDNRYLPVITTPSQELPTLRQENNFAFKFNAIDFNGDDLVWSIMTSDGSGFDKNSVRSIGFSQETYIQFSSDGTVDTFLIAGVPPWRSGKNYLSGEILVHQEVVYEVVTDHLSLVNYPPGISDDYVRRNINTTSVNPYSDFPEIAEFSIFGIFEPDSDEDADQDPDIVDLTVDVDYSVLDSGKQIKFLEPLPPGKYFVGVLLSYPEVNLNSETGVGFDRDGTVFDEGESQLPPRLSLDENGWLHGYLEPQQEEIKNYDFIITAEKKLVSQRKVQSVATEGAVVVDFDHVPGTSLVGRTVSLGPTPSTTTLVSEEIVDVGTDGDPKTIVRARLSQPLESDVSIGDSVTLRSPIIIASKVKEVRSSTKLILERKPRSWYIGKTISLGGSFSPDTVIDEEIINESGDAAEVTLSKPIVSPISVGDIVVLTPVDTVYRSKSEQYNLTVLGSLTDRIIWKSPGFLGSIVNGSVSELKIEAVSELGQAVRYSLVPNSKSRLPQALSLNLLNDGLISGRTTFRYFQLDQDATTFDKKRTRFDNLFQFNVKAETTNIKKIYRPSGRRNAVSNVTETVEQDGITLSSLSWEQEDFPNKIYLAYSGSTNFIGHEISGRNISKNTIIVGQTKLIDSNGAVYTELTLSQLLEGEVGVDDLVYILDGVVSSIKTFQLRIDIVHTEPFENLYFKAFPTLQQRQRFFDIINDQDIFPDELIYRKNDPWFGKANTIKLLAAAGIKSSQLNEYVSAIEKNHYWKQINFGEIKTAIAVDEFYNTKYEVVYIEIIDPVNLSESVVKEKVELPGNPYISDSGVIVAVSSSGAQVTLINDASERLVGAMLYGIGIPFGTKIQSVSGNTITLNRNIGVITAKTNLNYQIESRTIYPSTFANMNNNIVNALGYQAQGVFPDWMTSVQPDKSVLGFKRAVVLAYTVPGAANLIAYRLKSKNVSFNDIEFTIDRYQLDNALSKFFMPGEGQYQSSKETTFDRLTLGPGVHDGGVVDYAVEQTFDSINKRTVSYIRQNGGIDGIKSFEQGELLVFAKQEKYSNNTSPYDGWIDYQNLYIGDVPNDGSDIEGLGQDSPGSNDKFGFDSYRVVPGIKNKSLTVEQYLLTATSLVGSDQITLPWLLGVSYLGKSVQGTGIAAGTKVIAQSINFENNEVTATLNLPVTQNINVGSMVTLRASIISAELNDQVVSEELMPYSLAVESVPLGVANGMKLFGAGIPNNTFVVDVIDNVLVTNNVLANIVPGATIGYEVDNQRGGIWRININDDDLVTLEFVREVAFGEKIKILNGSSNGFTFMVYDNNILPGQTVPTYRRWSSDIETTGGYTVFDGNGTRFFDRRDNYQVPGEDDKYLKFPQIGVFE